MASITINTKVIFIYFHGFRLCRVPKKPKSLWFPGVFHSDQLEPHLGTGLSSAAAEELGRGNSDGFRGWKLPVSPGLWWVDVKSLGFLQFILLDLIVVLSQTQVVSWWYLDSLQKKCYNCLELGKLFLVVWEVDTFPDGENWVEYPQVNSHQHSFVKPFLNLHVFQPHRFDCQRLALLISLCWPFCAFEDTWVGGWFYRDMPP